MHCSYERGHCETLALIFCWMCRRASAVPISTSSWIHTTSSFIFTSSFTRCSALRAFCTSFVVITMTSEAGTTLRIKHLKHNHKAFSKCTDRDSPLKSIYKSKKRINRWPIRLNVTGIGEKQHSRPGRKCWKFHLNLRSSFRIQHGPKCRNHSPYKIFRDRCSIFLRPANFFSCVKWRDYNLREIVSRWCLQVNWTFRLCPCSNRRGFWPNAVTSPRRRVSARTRRRFWR